MNSVKSPELEYPNPSQKVGTSQKQLAGDLKNLTLSNQAQNIKFKKLVCTAQLGVAV